MLDGFREDDELDPKQAGWLVFRKPWTTATSQKKLILLVFPKKSLSIFLNFFLRHRQVFNVSALSTRNKRFPKKSKKCKKHSPIK